MAWLSVSAASSWPLRSALRWLHHMLSVILVWLIVQTWNSTSTCPQGSTCMCIDLKTLDDRRNFALAVCQSTVNSKVHLTRTSVPSDYSPASDWSTAAHA